jgi:hypothetical protein
MATMLCTLCGRPVEARKHIGVGTVALAIVTWGLWLIAIPFYQKRCSICKSPALLPLGPGVPSTSGSEAAGLAEIKQRLRLIEGELETTHEALERVTEERDFYRQLLEDPNARRTPPGRP